MARAPLALFVACAVVAAAPAPTSDPVGIYAVIDRVVLEPNADAPQRIQIWGVFSFADQRAPDAYFAPERGYLYYTFGQTPKLQAVLAEWSDLRALAGQPRAIGFGARYASLGRVRRPEEPAANADTYPLGFGIVRLAAAHDGPAVERRLQQVPLPTAPAAGATVPPGAIELVARNIANASARYVFEIETEGAREASPPIEPGTDGRTRWTPELRLRAGQTYTWRVRTTGTGWTGEPAVMRFTVGR